MRDHQEFPTSGVLASHLNVPLPGWGSEFPEERHMPGPQLPEIGDLREDDSAHAPGNPNSSASGETTLASDDLGAVNKAEVFAYVLTTVKVKNGKSFQTGCAPNFQGDCITLCTCMHRHRSWRRVGRGLWIAGFTGRSSGNQLFYLMQVGQEAASHYELWNSGYLPNRGAKSAASDTFGDVFEPNSVASHATRFDPNFYKDPTSNHVHQPTAWVKDICYPKLPSSNQPKLLVGTPTRSFLWSVPKYRYRYGRHPRFKFYQSLGDFYKYLV
jgi:hypothetical protein